MVSKGTIFLCLLEHLILISGKTLSGYQHHLHHSLQTDKIALLEFKRTIKSDPSSKLANWNDTTDVCSFTGVQCDKHHHRVVRINLNDSSLMGFLSPFISNLTQLRVLELVNNHMLGPIPPELSSLRHLRFLKLDENDLNGTIPDSFSFLANLTVITLHGNKLIGTIPPLFYNCTLLYNIDLSENALTGKIPAEIGNCKHLWNLNLYGNQLTGQLPLSLTNASELYNLDVENNSLSGELPMEIISKLPQLSYLHLSDNNMISHDNNSNLDPFFAALKNCTLLEEVELDSMNLGGKLPRSIGSLKNLRTMLLQENKISGSIPTELTHLSNLSLLNLTSNLLNGLIPVEISKLSALEQLCLSFNYFTSDIPAALGQLSHLGLLDLSNNRLSGKIPESVGNLVQINSLFLNNNLLSGKIPRSLGKCTDLYRLDLSYNRLTGPVPHEILGLSEIRIFLNLSHNQLEGSLPLELSKLTNVQEIDLSSNNLSGSIFAQISSCIAIRIINLSYNSLNGQLPETLGDLKNLEALDVSRNKLSGTIPRSLNKIHTLTFLNLSFNNLVGPIPSGGIFDSVTYWSFLDNEHLCGFVPGIPMCHQKRLYFQSRVFVAIFCVLISISAFFTTICCVIGCQYLSAIIFSGKSETERKKPPELVHNFPIVTFNELLEATGGFDEERLIGSGSYGRVFKGVLHDGTRIAVKVLNLQTGNSTKSFNRECQVLKRIRHRNLIRIITACSLPDFKAIVLPYMSNGSLDSRLYPHQGTGLVSGSLDLSLIQRVNICGDIAEGMAYLHHHSPVKVIHCDLKPSNVLLNDDMNALVTDFGIAKLVMMGGGGNAGAVENMENSTASILTGSIGYIAPEYGYGSSTSTKGDVYSFGVLVLEMVTRKRPTDDMFGGGLSLQKWVKNYYHRQIERVVDSSLIRAMRDETPEAKKIGEVAIQEMIELGILCTQESPSIRPTMLDVADDLDRLKRYLGGDTTTTFASSLGISSSTLFDD